MNHYLISWTIGFPMLGALLQALVASSKSRWFALAASFAASGSALLLIFSMKTQTAELQATEVFSWIGSYAITYDMGIDGLNALLVLLIAILFPILIGFEWNQKVGVRGMHGLFLILQTALFGTVFAQDLFLQFFFWGLSSLPFYFLVGIWGGEEREKASFRSMVASSLGNALIFIALILIYYSVEPHSFSLKELSLGTLEGKTFYFLGYLFSVKGVAFVLLSTGLALRAPIWPLQGWFTEVAQQAPFSVLIALSAATVPVALYLFIRIFYLLFPKIFSDFSNVIVAVGAVNLLMGGVCAATQRNLRRLQSFVCVSEVGLILMGIGSLNATGVVGAVYQQLILGLSLAGFGLFAGVISDRTGSCTFMNESGEKKMGGIVSFAPSIAVVAAVVIVCLLGFPGLGGFVGRALVMIGTFSVHPITVLIAGAAMLLASFYFFSMYKFIFLGNSLSSVVFEDLTLREKACIFPIVFSLLLFGLYPKPLIELIRPTVLTLLSTVK